MIDKNILKFSRKNLVLVALLLVSIFVTSTAFAADDEANDEAALPTAGAAMGGAATTSTGGGDQSFNFEDDDLTGDRVGPDGADIMADKHGLTSSLIQIPDNFNAQLIDSVDNI